MAPNRLAKETSAYLKQHQDNPVDWYPWGPEALEKAKKENKPVFLSIGYSACHWCHVMEHESFQDQKIAEILNQNFVSIKVDREERPDLDQIYQNVAQAMTQSGGWPLTVFLTPDLKPFYGGTYFPPEDRYGRPGLGRLLLSLVDAYKNKLEDIQWNSKRLMDAIIALESIPGSDLPVSADKTGPAFEKIFHTCQELLSHVDLEKGGIEGAPKFPNAMVFSLLWRIGLAKDWQPALNAVVLTLRKMAEGGIYDHLRGGFHRYSVDSNWLIPHFEKMLYDNGVLIKLYAEVLLTADNSVLVEADRELFLNVLVQTVQYLKSEMLSREGGFFSSQDADSEGHEGKYFVWTQAELKEILDPIAYDVFKLRFGISEKGNFEKGANVLNIQASTVEISKKLKLDESKVKSSVSESIEKLLKCRSKRIAPSKDEKIIAGWNALMMSGLLWTSQALEKFGYKSVAKQAHEMAEGAYQFITKNLVQEGIKDFGQRLWSVYQGGKPKLNAYLDDYAFMSMAALDMARFSEGPLEYVDHAENWIHVIIRHFRDANGPGYFFTSDDHEQLIHRPKTIFDQAIPSGTGVTLNCLAALSEMGSLTGEGAIYEKELYSQLSALFTAMTKSPYACGELLCSALMAVMGPIAVSGKNAQKLSFHPHVFHKSSEDLKEEKLVVCHRKTCEIPAENYQEAESSILRKVRRSVE